MDVQPRHRRAPGEGSRGIAPGRRGRWAAAALATIVTAIGVVTALVAPQDPGEEAGGVGRGAVARTDVRTVARAVTEPLPVTSPLRRRTAEASAILERWDRARATAYAEEDRAALADLYALGSSAAAAELALFDRYRAAGVRVVGLRMQVLAVEVLPSPPDHLQLLVTDRVHRARAVAQDGSKRFLPSDDASTRVLVLRRDPAAAPGWVISAVRPRSGP